MSRSTVQNTDVHAGAAHTHTVVAVVTAAAVAGVVVGGVVDCGHHAGQARLADAVHHVPQVLLGRLARHFLTFLRFLITVSVSDVGLQVTSTQIRPSTPVIAIPATTLFIITISSSPYHHHCPKFANLSISSSTPRNY